MQHAFREMAGVHRHDDSMTVSGMSKDLMASLCAIDSQPHRSNARTACRGVTAGSRDVTPRR
jgi:hypothetical protein